MVPKYGYIIYHWIIVLMNLQVLNWTEIGVLFKIVEHEQSQGENLLYLSRTKQLRKKIFEYSEKAEANSGHLKQQ